jgi:hypothetical protein
MVVFQMNRRNNHNKEVEVNNSVSDLVGTRILNESGYAQSVRYLSS